jgi:hypothetical protein
MVPVVCMPILETNSLPGTGWAISKWGRDYYDHVANIKRMLDGLVPLKMRPWTANWHGEVIEIDGVEWSAGCCNYNAATRMVTITELPFGMKTDTYIYGREKKASSADDDDDDHKATCLSELDLVEQSTIRDESGPTQIRITFLLKDGAIDYIAKNYGSSYFNPLQDYLSLKGYMGAMLNFIDDDGRICAFSTYEGAMIPWFEARLRLYPLRFEREIIIINLQIAMIREQLRYITNRTQLGLSKVKRARQIAILEEAKFARVNMVRLKHPKVPNADIASVVYGEDASYDYLLRISDADAAEESIAALDEKIRELLARRDELNSSDIAKRTWLAEIAEVTKFIDAAMRDGWVPKGKYNYTS